MGNQQGGGRQSIKLSSNAKAQEAWELFQNGKYELSKKLYESLIQHEQKQQSLSKSSNDLAQYYNEYALLLTRGFQDYKQAEINYKEALKLDNFNFMYLGNYAALLRLTNRLPEAVRYYEKCIASNDKDALYLGNYADCLRCVGKYKESKKYFQMSIKIASNRASTLQNYATLLFEMNDFLKAKYYYKQAILNDDKNPVRYYYLARLLFDNNEYDKSINALKTSLELSNNKLGQSYWLLGKIYMDLEEYKEAVNYFSKSIEVNGKKMILLTDYILCLVYMKQFQSVQVHIEKAKKINEGFLYLWLIQAYALSQVNKIDGANQLFHAVMDKAPKIKSVAVVSRSTFLYFYALHLHYTLKKYHLAKKYYSEILTDLKPKWAMCHYHYCICLKDQFEKVTNKNNSLRLVNVDSNVKKEDTKMLKYLSLSNDDSLPLYKRQVTDYDNEESKTQTKKSVDMNIDIDYDSLDDNQISVAIKHLKRAKHLNDKIPLISNSYNTILSELKNLSNDSYNESTPSKGSINLEQSLTRDISIVLDMENLTNKKSKNKGKRGRVGTLQAPDNFQQLEEEEESYFASTTNILR